MNFKAQDYLAKLLAKENLTVRHGNYSTASFNIEDRILNLPLWADKGKDVYDLLVGHEVGHALYTPVDGWHDSDKEIPGVPRSMINIIEDIRIEKKIQRTYPGIVRAFKKGYKVLFDDNLFGTVDKDLTTYNFMDRLNIHSKGRGYAPIEFNATEQMFVDLAMGVETWNDVLNACQEINDWLKAKEDYNDEDEEDNILKSNPQDGEENQEGGEENQEGNNEQSIQDEGPTDPEESITDQAQRQNESDLIDTNEQGKQPLYSSGISPDNIKNIPVSYKQLRNKRLSLNEFNENSVYKHEELPSLYKNMLVENGIMKTVNLMAREFERKKAAWEYSRSSEAKKGSLNVNKLHQYKYSEDIFLTVQKLAQAKSHGIFMLVDWSGSMQGILEDVIKQTITIALFCNRVNIPFEAYSFTTQYSENSDNINNNDISRIGNIKLVNIITSTLKGANLDEALMHLWAVTQTSIYSSPLYYSKSCRLDRTGATPLLQSIIACEPIINKMKAKYSIQNMNVMVLTDGLADKITISGDDLNYSEIDAHDIIVKFGKNFIRGTDTYELVKKAIKTLGVLTQSKIIGFFLAGNKHDFSFAINATNNYSHDIFTKMRAKWKKEGVLTLNNSNGYDEFFIVKVGGKSLSSEFEVKDKGDGIAIKDIKREFRKFSKKKIQSKQLVNKITSAVAA